jgi:hypothetical protein
MMNRGYWMLVGMIAGLSAGVSHAQTIADRNQWQATDKTMFELVSNGYELKAVVLDGSKTSAQAPDTLYYLQNGRQVAMCREGVRGGDHFVGCSALVR